MNAWIAMARHVSSRSKDPSTKVGCVVVGPDNELRSMGYNGFPRGVADDERLLNRTSKYVHVVHAEANAIAQAARVGIPLKGCTLYCTFPPCTECAKLIIQAGITKVVFPKGKVPLRWLKNFTSSVAMMREAGVCVEVYVND